MCEFHNKGCKICLSILKTHPPPKKFILNTDYLHLRNTVNLNSPLRVGEGEGLHLF